MHGWGAYISCQPGIAAERARARRARALGALAERLKEYALKRTAAQDVLIGTEEFKFALGRLQSYRSRSVVVISRRAGHGAVATAAAVADTHYARREVRVVPPGSKKAS